MMKRIMACLVAVVCLLTSFAFAEGLTMKVVNVNTAVNLRKGPSTDTESLTQVPVGTIVTDCVQEGKWYQVNYNGTVGYIRGDKLAFAATSWRSLKHPPKRLQKHPPKRLQKHPPKRLRSSLPKRPRSSPPKHPRSSPQWLKASLW